MNGWTRSLRSLADALVAPGAWSAGPAGTAPIGTTCIVVGTLAAALQLVQARLLAPAVLQDPLAAEAPGGPQAVMRTYWILRVLLCAGTPLFLLLRSAALASLLHAVGLLSGASAAWKSLLSLALQLEIVFWIEAACITFLLWLQPPGSLEALEAARIRAGLDLLWQPASESLRALLAAANAFTVWWAMLLALGTARLLRLRPARAAGVALPLWLGVVALRFWLQPH